MNRSNSVTCLCWCFSKVDCLGQSNLFLNDLISNLVKMLILKYGQYLNKTSLIKNVLPVTSRMYCKSNYVKLMNSV